MSPNSNSKIVIRFNLEFLEQSMTIECIMLIVKILCGGKGSVGSEDPILVFCSCCSCIFIAIVLVFIFLKYVSVLFFT